MQLQEAITPTKLDNRPTVAIGHVQLLVSNVSTATDFFIKLGLRYIHQSEDIAILELRGGTHLILKEVKRYIMTAGTKAPFDLMVDNIMVTRNFCISNGLFPSPIEKDQVHSWFIITGPDGYLVTIISSHTNGRIV
ncbi:glyoxalase/bleomycin resistance protein/dioxygenase [Calothrix sp. NIES-4071]|nr:glyoxalase/bleomycin resistance protein/dioxygenase [Calothrix sp. NIES-4071]BAZ56108.1 glyoxalase/bleomycin resistance protein/dioxygenase [Calothrix sp. NIES-4105]